MDDNTVDIRDDEINVEKIMQKIRENVQRRQANGELPPDPGSLLSQLHISAMVQTSMIHSNEISHI